MRPTLTLRNAIGAACSGNAAASSSKINLPPIRYHIFRNPLPYPTGLKLQNDIIDRRLKRKEREPERRSGQDVLLLLEHTPTYTTGRRDNSPNPTELHPEERKVQNVGADFFITKRGGQVTYHGPGQLVGYPIFDLSHMDLSTRCYVEYLQRLLAEHCRSDLGLENILAPHPDGHVGVFASPTEKVASIGIHLRHRITSHGFAINVTDEPIKWFDLVMACGLADVRAVSLVQLLESQASSVGVMPPSEPSVRSTAKALIKRFEQTYGRAVEPLHEAGDEEVRELQELCEAAEEEAERLNKQSGGWPTAPRIAPEQVS